MRASELAGEILSEVEGSITMLGAERGTRTPTGRLSPADFKSAASANSAIPALLTHFWCYTSLAQTRNCRQTVLALPDSTSLQRHGQPPVVQPRQRVLSHPAVKSPPHRLRSWFLMLVSGTEVTLRFNCLALTFHN